MVDDRALSLIERTEQTIESLQPSYAADVQGSLSLNSAQQVVLFGQIAGPTGNYQATMTQRKSFVSSSSYYSFNPRLQKQVCKRLSVVLLIRNSTLHPILVQTRQVPRKIHAESPLCKLPNEIRNCVYSPSLSQQPWLLPALLIKNPHPPKAQVRI